MSLFCLQANRCAPKGSVLFCHKRVKTMPCLLCPRVCFKVEIRENKNYIHQHTLASHRQVKLNLHFGYANFQSTIIQDRTSWQGERKKKKRKISTFSFKNKKSKALFLLLRNNRQTSIKQNDTIQTIRIMLNLATKLKVN